VQYCLFQLFRRPNLSSLSTFTLLWFILSHPPAIRRLTSGLSFVESSCTDASHTTLSNCSISTTSICQ
ncbi:hypothetical protein T265_15784, partial [Opisthorchis viverrini]